MLRASMLRSGCQVENSPLFFMELKLIKEPLPLMGSGVERSEGLHVTDIIRDLDQKFGKKYPDDERWNLELAAELGFMFENYIESLLTDAVRPGEIELDGIILSPDGILFERGKVILLEYKFTWKSARKTPEDVWKWMAQLKAYCKALGVVEARMYIMYVNGDWKTEMPQLPRYDITFTQLEIDENWQMLVNNAKSKGWL